MSSADLDILDDSLEEVESQPEVIEKVKKPRTQKQIDAFEKVRALRDVKRGERKDVRLKEADERTKIVEEKIVKKALAIKKKQILRDVELDAVSSDGESIPLEVVKKIMKYKKRKNSPVPAEINIPTIPTFSFI